MKSKIDRFMLKLRESFIFQVITCITLSFIVIICFFLINRAMDNKKPIGSNSNLINIIEEMNIENNRLSISGYAFIFENDSNYNSISIYLRNVKSGKKIKLNTEQMYRADVKTYYGSNYDYGNSGFLASANINKFKSNETYEIIINIKNNKSADDKTNITSTSNHFIYNNELYTYNPKEFDIPSLNTESEFLKKIFYEGKLYFYDKDKGLFVYQYMDKLYWVATEDFEFDKENMTYIIYHLYTSQEDKLPENRIKYKFDNLDFIFEQYEIMDEITEPYRVAAREIPNDYVITYISTGVYDRVNDIINWIKNFHINMLHK